MLLESIQFGNYLKEQREQKNITQADLGDGLLDATTLGKFESGKRYPGKMMRDRLLARLGESCYDYECYLQYDDFDHWKLRDSIINSLNERNITAARSLLEQYKSVYLPMDASSSFEYPIISFQFYLTMKVQLMELTDEPPEEIFPVLRQAAFLTISNLTDTFPEEKILSAQEINLALEFISYNARLSGQYEALAPECEKIIRYLSTKQFDKEDQAQLLSKTAYYYCRSMQRHFKNHCAEDLSANLFEHTLAICNQGLDALRTSNRSYYIIELLQIKTELLSTLLKGNTYLNIEKIQQYNSEYEQTTQYLSTFRALYHEYGICETTCGYLHFYREQEVHCINDVIRARRKTLGLSQESLTDICTIKTIRRIEQRKSRVHLMLAQELFSRLNLSMEMQHGMIITTDKEAIQLEKDVRLTTIAGDYTKASFLLDELSQLISNDEPINQQYISYTIASLNQKSRKIDSIEFMDCMKHSLEFTVPLKNALQPIEPSSKKRTNEKYLTNAEITILLNCSFIFSSDSNNHYAAALQDFYSAYEHKLSFSSMFGMYHVVMTHIASYLGNMKKYELSNSLSKKLITAELSLHRLSNIGKNLHSIQWNSKKAKEQEIQLPNYANQKSLLQYCMDIYSFCNAEHLKTKCLKEFQSLDL